MRLRQGLVGSPEFKMPHQDAPSQSYSLSSCPQNLQMRYSELSQKDSPGYSFENSTQVVRREVHLWDERHQRLIPPIIVSQEPLWLPGLRDEKYRSDPLHRKPCSEEGRYIDRSGPCTPYGTQPDHAAFGYTRPCIGWRSSNAHCHSGRGRVLREYRFRKESLLVGSIP